jgi:hypothetical protein
MFEKNFTLLSINESYDDDDDICNCLLRNGKLEWRRVFYKIIDVCIGMFPLELPNYVLLEIVDWFPFWVSNFCKAKIITLRFAL